MGIYFISAVVFVAVLLVLTAILLLLESTIMPKGRKSVVVNHDAAKALDIKAGTDLLSGLGEHRIYLPSGCGGTGTCGLCKCRVESGGGELLPTELPHLSRAERLDLVRLACQVKVKENMAVAIPPQILDVKKYTAEVILNRSVATFIRELTLKVQSDAPLAFQSGGYMQMDIPPYKKLAYGTFDIKEPYNSVWEQQGLLGLTADNPTATRRAYSMANYPGEDYFRFTIRIEPPPKNSGYAPGIGSSWLFALKPGDKLTLSGPYGEFFVKDTPREMCFIGGGAGMAPLRSHILDQLKNKRTKRKISFWYGARSRMESFYDNECRQLAEEFPNFTYHLALSEPAPDDDWDGSVGFVHQIAYDLYLQEHKEPDEIEYYLCGPPLMLKATLKMLDGLGVDPGMIAYDDFGDK